MIKLAVWAADYVVKRRAAQLGRPLTRSEELRARLAVALVLVSPLLVFLAVAIVNAIRLRF